MRLFLLSLLFIPLPANAQWSTFDHDGREYASICSDDADETCVYLTCEGNTPSFSLVSLGAWAVKIGDEYPMFLSIGGGGVRDLEGEVEAAAGFGPEFFAISAKIGPEQVTLLKEQMAFAVGLSNGELWTFNLRGSGAALSSALAQCGS
ncbi:hypothetical protein [Actibacterium sp. 188UL27-1]|uniref:hypothetical protein n=1 Tax=Actibacterium sp. 188UL27-1 TaxID=2786961 RepID=UPI0019579BBD|nr:hypothetical protein [Actibacterium sp. 188UL27-1]MBM7067065.1 hypothetical protein [Actibacterium sp. 188UL27-1]